MRLVVPLLVIISALSAGCADLRATLEAPPPPAYARVDAWGFAECQYVVAVLPIPAGEIGARVPEGFRVLPVHEIPNFPVPREPRGDGNLGVEAFRCASGTGLNATSNLTDVSYGSVFSFVEPPEDKRDANATFHFLKWDVLVPDEDRRALLANAGVPAVAGNATFSRFQDVGPVKLLQANLELGEDAYAFEGAGQPQGTDAFAAISFVEFTDVGAGHFVEWRTNMTSTQALAGSGFVDLAGASWVRSVVGSDRAQAYYVTGTGSFENGTISLPYRG